MSKATKYAEQLRRIASMQRAHGTDDEARDNERIAAVIEEAAKLREADRGENDKAVSAAMRELYVALDALPEGSEE